MSTPLEDQSSLVGILNRVQAWAAAADQKIGVLTAIQTLVCGFLFGELSDWLETPATTMPVRVGIYIGCVLLAKGIFHCVAGLFPRLTKLAPGQSVTFFSHIQALPIQEYRARLKSMSAEEWAEDYVTQIHVNATITHKKHLAIKKSVKWFGFGLIVIAVTYFAAVAGF